MSTLTLTERQVRALAHIASIPLGRIAISNADSLSRNEMADLNRRFQDYLDPLAPASVEVEVTA